MSVSNKKASTKTLKDETWATLKEIAESQKKADRRMQEFDLSMEKSREEFDRRMEEFDLSMKKSSEEFDRRMKEINKNLGSWDKNIGDFAEEYFQNSFDQGKKNFFGEHFDKLRRNLKGDESEDEYDIVLINGKYVGIIEVKFKGHVNDIPKILKKVKTFKENFPKYKKRKIYLGLASMSFYLKLEEECKSKGIAIIKQVGDKVIINDKHLKAY